MKAEKRTEYTITFTSAELALLRDIAGFDVTIPELFNEGKGTDADGVRQLFKDIITLVGRE